MKTHYILFTGKGGVGKTTCAAATALRLAEQGHKTLIVSTDPAHSLSDSFCKKLGGKEKQIRTNLFAVEIDPKENIDKMKDVLGGAGAPDLSNSPLASMGMNINPQEMLGGLTDMGSMPGMDEVAALNKFLEYMDSADYEYVVFDTAPTGHTLNFLKLPELMGSWVGKMLKFRMQMSNAMSMFKQILPFSQEQEKDHSLEHLEKMKGRIQKGKQILTNPNRTEFVMVLIPQEMSIAESERAMKQLKDTGITVSKIIVNQVQPLVTDCGFCKERHTLHEKKLKEINKRFKGLPIKKVRLFREEITGEKLLEIFGTELE